MSPDSAVDMRDMSWVPDDCKLFLVFDSKSRVWNVGVRLRADYLGYIATAASAVMEEALAEVREKIHKRGGEVA